MEESVLNNTETVLLGLLRRALFGQPFVIETTEVDWAQLYQEARAHTVQLLLYDAMTGQELDSMPLSLANMWRSDALQILQRNLLLLREQENILNILRKSNIPVTVFKGSACADNYPRPEMRCFGDIDLLVSKANIHLAQQLLKEQGYTKRKEACPWHVALQRDKYVVELHFAVSGIPDGVVGERLVQYLQSLPQLDICQQAVALLLHKLNHLRKDGLGLRQLCDWALFVQKWIDEESWTQLKPRLESFGLLHFAKVITRLCVEYLSLPEQAASWCMDADQILTADLLHDILQTGNFGSKQQRLGQKLFTDGGSGGRIMSLWRTSLYACKVNWPACKEHPFLLPVAPCVLLFRYWKQRKSYLRPPLRLWKSFRLAKSRQKLYQALRPFEINLI